ncbi:hypothetical protein [Helicobacter sp. 23-1046]
MTKMTLLRAMFLGFVLSLFANSLGATSTENYSRWLTRLGMDLDYTHRSVNGMWMHGVGTGWILETAYIKKQVKVALDARYGRTPMDLHAGYNTYGTFATDVNIIKNEERFNRWQGATGRYLDVSLKAGWNIADSIEEPFYINLGYVLLDMFVHHSNGYPFVFNQVHGGIFIEAEGKKRLGDKFALTYLGRVSLAGAQVGISDQDKNLTGSNNGGAIVLKASNDIGYELRANVGITYDIGKRTSFFARLNAKYKYLPATQSTQLTTIANNYGNNNPLDTGVVGNQTFNIAYPNAYQFSGGLSFGFEF